jgi:hypothetical protein
MLLRNVCLRKVSLNRRQRSKRKENKIGYIQACIFMLLLGLRKHNDFLFTFILSRHGAYMFKHFCLLILKWKAEYGTELIYLVV